MCDLRPHSHGLIHSLCWQGCPVNTFWSEAGCPTCAEFVYSGFAEVNREPPGFCLLSKTGIARALPGISLIPISAFCSTDTIRLRRRAGRATAQNTGAQHGNPFNDEQQTLVFPGGECLHKTELNTTYQNSPRAKHYRPTHGRVRP